MPDDFSISSIDAKEPIYSINSSLYNSMKANTDDDAKKVTNKKYRKDNKNS